MENSFIKEIYKKLDNCRLNLNDILENVINQENKLKKIKDESETTNTKSSNLKKKKFYIWIVLKI